MRNLKVIVDPRCRISYASYYIKGLQGVVGKKNVIFNEKLFLPHCLLETRYDFNKGMSFIYDGRKIFIDFDDSNEISEKHYQWACVYAKVNVKKIDDQNRSKLFPIGPSFGINILDLTTIMILMQLLFIKSKPIAFLDYFKDYLFMLIRRKKYSLYCGSVADDDYTFSISTLWYDELSDKTTNRFRALFFRTCAKYFKVNEGGLFLIGDEVAERQFPKYKEYKEIYKDIITTKRISPSKYIKKTKKSAVVFNTPSVSGCHGWKMGEYFAMGKAMISTPVNNILPFSFENYKHCLIVENQKDMDQAISILKSDKAKRTELEKISKEYFETYLSPTAVINRILLFHPNKL